MLRQYGKYFFGCVGLYIVVANGSNFGKVMTAAASGGSQLTKTLQGR